MNTLHTLTFLSGFGCLIALMLAFVTDTNHKRRLDTLGWIAWVSAFVSLGSALIRWGCTQ
jgi:prolipoprotein diacylglyceryltransferase